MDRQNDIGFAVRTLSNLIKRDVEKSKAELGIEGANGVNGWAITYLYDNKDKEIFQKDFESKFSIRPSTASKILKTMEQKGFIIRQSVENDARLKKITLTKKAVELHEKVISSIEDRELRLREGISPSEIEAFFKIVNKFKANMEKDYD